MRDVRGRQVRVGDRVQLWPRQVGLVVCVFDDEQFHPRYPASEWSYLQQGTLIETEDGNLFHYLEPDEDFEVVTRD